MGPSVHHRLRRHRIQAGLVGIRFATIHASSSPATELTVTLNDADVIGSAQAPNDDDMPPPPVRGFSRRR